MSSNNSSPESIIGVFAIVVIGMTVLFIMAVFAFVALALTVVAIAAWNEPVELFGDTVDPEGARGYVYRGLIGMVAAPLFTIFSCILFQYDMNEITEHGWKFIVLAGYCIGSLGIEIAIQQAREEAEAAAALQQEILPALPPQQPVPKPVHREEQPAFRFETWDDEGIIK